MKNILILTALLTFAASGYSQSFKLVGSLDPEGDDFHNLGKDIKSIEIASNIPKDSIWIRIRCYDSLTGDHGLSILFDTNQIAGDGKKWNYTNNGGNTSLKYEKKLDLLNNKYFPPAHVILYDTTGQNFTQNIGLQRPDSFTVVLSLKLSDIDSDGKFNLVAGSGQFDGTMNDNLPNSGFFDYDAHAPSTTIEPQLKSSAETLYYPNPTSGKLVYHSQVKGKLRIVNWLGEEVYHHSLQEGINLLDMSHLPQGNYFLMEENSNTHYVNKLVKL
jgi:hypothetical protein